MAAPAFLPRLKEQLKNVLFATDFSEGSLRALPYVGGIARAFGSTVHLCHIIAPTPLAAGLAAPALYEAAGREATDHFAALLGLPELEGLHPRLVLAEGTIEDELMKAIREREIDLIVAGTHGRTGWRKLLLGSVVETICRITACPLLTVGPGLALHGEVLFKQILFPTDLSHESLSIVPYLQLLAEKYGSRITALYVTPGEAGSTPNGHGFKGPIPQKVAKAFETGISTALPEFIVEFGDAVETVLKVADEKKVDLVAMGIRNAFTPGTPLRSSTAYRIMAGAPCPVLTSREVQR